MTYSGAGMLSNGLLSLVPDVPVKRRSIFSARSQARGEPSRDYREDTPSESRSEKGRPPVKSPWASLPPVDKTITVSLNPPVQPLPRANTISHIDPSALNNLLVSHNASLKRDRRSSQRDSYGYDATLPPLPVKDTAPEDFTRLWRDDRGDREVFNSHSGRYEPVTDIRSVSVRDEVSAVRQTTLYEPVDSADFRLPNDAMSNSLHFMQQSGTVTLARTPQFPLHNQPGSPETTSVNAPYVPQKRKRQRSIPHPISFEHLGSATNGARSRREWLGLTDDGYADSAGESDGGDRPSPINTGGMGNFGRRPSQQPEDIVLGPPKLAFASANRTARAVDSSEKRGVNSIDGEHLRDRFPRTRGERWTRDRDRDEEGSRMQSKGQILYDFISQGDDEVTVSIGDRVLIIDDYSSDEWWSVRLLKNGQEGVVPSSYVQITAKIETRTRASPLPASPEIGTGMYSMHPVERYKQDKVRDYSGVQRPRQELSGVAYQDLTRPTPSGEILNQAAQAVEIKKQIEQQRKSRKEYLDNYWARPHEPSPQLQRRTTAEGETVPQVTQGIQSPHLPSSNPAGPTHEKIHEEKSKKTPYTLLRATNVAHEQASSPFYMAYTISQDTTIKTESLQKAKLSAIKDRRICFKSKPSLLERLTNKSYNTSLNATLFDNLQ